MELYSIVPTSTDTYTFFPFYPQRLTLQVWIDYAGSRIAVLTLIYGIYEQATKYKSQLLLLWVLMCGYLIDYFLRYNMPITGTHISYTNFMMVAMGVIIIKTILSV